MGYLDQYETGYPLFENILRMAAYVLVSVILLGSFYWLFFRNWVEERHAKEFLGLIQEQNYSEAYTVWGCTEETPCKFYPYGEFMEDWGPESPLGQVTSYHLGRSYTQRGGVIVEVHINGRKQPNLWIDRDTREISFFPY